MKRAALLLLSVFLLAGYARLGAQGAQSLDKIRLKDGRTVSGQIVEEHAAALVMLVRGIRRTYDRAFITGVSYGAAGADAPGPDNANYAGAEGDAPMAAASGPGAAGDAVPVAPERPEGSLVAALASRYRVPVRDVLWVRAQGVSDADLPLVFLIAATGAVTPRQVLGLVHKGWTWVQIEDYFQMEPDAVAYEPGPWEPYPYYDPYLCVGLGWNYGWGYGYGGYGWGGRGSWSGGRGNWGGRRGAWTGAPGGGRVPIGAARGGGSWSGAGRAGAGRSGAGRSAAGGGGGGGHGHR